MWKSVKLGDVLSLQNGYAFKSKEYVNDGYFIMRITNVQQGFISTHNPKYVKIEDNSKFSKFVLGEGDILVSLTGDVGRVGVIKEEHLPAALNQRVARITDVKASYLDSNFLFIYLNSELFRKQVENFAHGAAQANVSTKDILSIEISLPPLEEQHRIVAKLHAAFAEIDEAVNLSTRKMVRSKQALIQLKDDAVKALIEKFPTEILGKFAEFKNGLNYSKSDKGSFLKIVGVGDFKSNFFVDNTSLQTIRVKGMSNNYLLKSGDIIIVRSNGNKELIGRSMLVKDVCESMSFSGFSIRCRLNNEKLLPEFICHILKSNLIRRRLIDGGGGSSISNLNQKMLSDIPIPIVEHDKQIRFLTRMQLLEENFEILVQAFTEKLNLLHSLKSAILSQELQSEVA